MTKQILVIQHAGVMGGSVTTLVQIARQLPAYGYRLLVCLLNPTSDVIRFHEENGIPYCINRRILPFPHTSGSWMHFGDPINSYACLKGLLFWRRSLQETERLVQSAACDLVHLNSSILLPSAFALHHMGQHFIWHVREAAQPRYAGNRLRLLRRCLTRFPAERVFLSASDRREWMGRGELGVVIPHGVPQAWFEDPPSGERPRETEGLPLDVKIILYVGGFVRIKGIFILLHALRILKSEGIRFVCIMPGTNRVRGGGWRSKIGRAALKTVQGGTDEARALQMIRDLDLQENLKLMTFQTDMLKLLQSCDMLVFPATVPHFAVPVIEAAAAGRAVVASDYPAMRELVADGDTGLLVRAGDPDALASAIASLCADDTRRHQLGDVARARARQFRTVTAETKSMAQVYERALALA